MHTPTLPTCPCDTPSLDPDGLEHWLTTLVAAYQRSRAALDAWAVCHCMRALIGHPDYEGSDEERCAYTRLARQWDWLAQRDWARLDGARCGEAA